VALSFLPINPQENIDISKLISKCSGLKTLILYDNLGKLVVSPGLHLTAKLESVHVSIDSQDDQRTLGLLHYLSNDSQNQHIRSFSMRLHHLTDDILKELAKRNYSFLPSQIQEYGIFTSYIYRENPFPGETTLPSSDIFCSFFASLSRLTALTKLSLCTRIDEIDSMKSLGNIFNHLQNLRHFQLQIFEGEKIFHGEALLIDLSVYNVHRLQSFSLKLSSNFRFREFIPLLDKLASIQELEFLAIDSIDVDPREKETIEKIAKTLDKFPICKTIDVGRNHSDESLSIQLIEAESLSISS